MRKLTEIKGDKDIQTRQYTNWKDEYSDDRIGFEEFCSDYFDVDGPFEFDEKTNQYVSPMVELNYQFWLYGWSYGYDEGVCSAAAPIK